MLSMSSTIVRDSDSLSPKNFTHPEGGVCKVLVINRKNVLSEASLHDSGRFPTYRDSEIAPTSFIYIFLQNIYTHPSILNLLTNQ